MATTQQPPRRDQLSFGLDAHDIDDALERLAAAIKASPDADLLAGWTVASLAAKLDLMVTLDTTASDPDLWD